MMFVSAQPGLHLPMPWPPGEAWAASRACSPPDELRGVEADAGAIRAALVSANRDQTRQLLAQLKALSSRLSVPASRRARRSAGVIQAAITQAEQQLECLSDEDCRRLHNESAPDAFARQVYHAMSRRAQHFYDRIDERATYRLAPVMRSGQVLETARQDVQGEELRQDFSLIKYHSMPEAGKRAVLTRSFGTAPPGLADGEAAADTAALSRARGELMHLHRALRTMEAYQALIRVSRARGDLYRMITAIALDHEHFVRAHAQADALMAVYDRLLAQPDDAEAEAQLARLRARMKKTLRDDIIEGVLLDADRDDQASGVGSLRPALTPAPPGSYRRGLFME